MRFLIVGAGALGGYFGGRMLECGLDVTFLVRAGRAAQLATTGLVIKSRKGDLTIPAPPTIGKDQLAGHYDVVLVSCKAYDLDATMEDFAPAVGPDTVVIPMLNGMRHLEALDRRFGAERIAGGLVMISAALDGEGVIHHFNDFHTVMFGERSGVESTRMNAIADAWSRANFEGKSRTDIVLAMWEKWCSIASIAGVTCSMRATIGDVMAAGASNIGVSLFDECSAVATACGFAPRADQRDRAMTILLAPGSPISASMLKDIERGARTEGEHIFGNLIELGTAHAEPMPTLRMAHAHVSSYEARRAREAA
jgi:2-dehydropantoate 2-reductase